jgi:hypothetical protein
VLPPPRSFSQGATSFVASRCQGIHQMPLPIAREPLDPHAPTHASEHGNHSYEHTRSVTDVRCQMSQDGKTPLATLMHPHRHRPVAASDNHRRASSDGGSRPRRRLPKPSSRCPRTRCRKTDVGCQTPALKHRNSFSFRSPGRPVTLGRHRLAPLLRHCPLTWWSRSESNRRPPECKSGALPTELRPRYQRSDAAGFQISEEAL